MCGTLTQSSYFECISFPVHPIDKTWAVEAVLMAVEVLCLIHIHFLSPFLGIVVSIKSALTVSVFLIFHFFNQPYSIKMVCFGLVFFCGVVFCCVVVFLVFVCFLFVCFSGPRVRLLLCLMRLLNFIHSRGRFLSLPD